LLSLPATLLSPFLSLIPTLLTLPQPDKRTHQSAYNGGSGAQHGSERISIHILAQECSEQHCEHNQH
jgi:hypothetical protein